MKPTFSDFLWIIFWNVKMPLLEKNAFLIMKSTQLFNLGPILIFFTIFVMFWHEKPSLFSKNRKKVFGLENDAPQLFSQK